MANRFYPFQLIPLPWETTAFPNFLSSENLTIHHGQFYKKYVDSLNSLVLEYPELKDTELAVIVQNYTDKIHHNAAQILNHEFFWKCLSPTPTTPSDRLYRYIEANFGTFQKFKDQFSQKVIDHFASGWVWLVQDPSTAFLLIIDGQDDYNPINDGYVPLLVIDVWEHSFYIDYLTDKKSYITNFWPYVNWSYVTQIAHEMIFGYNYIG